jgi:hydrogenase maturation protein HypF
MDKPSGLRIHITGIVQGVGFRPFVYGLAARLALTGWVRNTSAGVDIEVDGSPERLQAFVHGLQAETPPLARIDGFEVQERPPNGFTGFEIVHSEAIPGAFQPVSPDASICPDCLRELYNPRDRRYRYPFINCTNCGPRFTIIEDIPYDRPATTMVGFPLCPECEKEYGDPTDRRFHAQPVACLECGPTVWLELPGSTAEPWAQALRPYQPPGSERAEGSLRPDQPPGSVGGDGSLRPDQPPGSVGGDRSLRPDQPPGSVGADGVRPGILPNLNREFQQNAGNPLGEAALLAAQTLLAEGKILAVKGLGGFHLACDATDPQAVAELRRRKLRVDKPFALMMPDLDTVRQHCSLSQAEARLLESPQRPIVILRRRTDSTIAKEVAPGQDTLGVMLPYTPLHYLLFSLTGPSGGDLPPLVMTSGNLSEEPIAVDNAEARQRLGALADAFLMHNRPIRTRCDDSVMRVLEIEPPLPVPLRRSRGYSPFPVHLAWESPILLAVGAELKNTFCLAQERYAFLSHHIGDLENYETLRSFEDGTAHFERLFRARPEALAYDLHPDYLSTRYALERAEREGLPAVGVQHHHAHVAACLAEHGLTFVAGKRQAVIGIAFDGTGYGDDGAIWGGEFLIAGYQGYRRAAHLAYAPLPGGDRAVREPWRVALAWLSQAGIEWEGGLPPVDFALHCTPYGAQALEALERQLTAGLNSPLTSSMGRLFDAAAALAGVRQQVNYEAQAAIEFEALADPDETGVYPFTILPPAEGAGSPYRIDPSPLFRELVADLRAGVSLAAISARFHRGAAEMVRQVVVLLRAGSGLEEVALSGGVWQNFTLLKETRRRLLEAGFTVYIHQQAPANDGGLALGQAAVAAHLLR